MTQREQVERDPCHNLGLFLPRPWLSVDPGRVLRDAPIRRGRGDAPVYVRGSVTHAGREPVQLGYWRRVVTSARARARASELVASCG